MVQSIKKVIYIFGDLVVLDNFSNPKRLLSQRLLTCSTFEDFSASQSLQEEIGGSTHGEIIPMVSLEEEITKVPKSQLNCKI